MEKIKNTLRHPFVKSLILGVLTLVIGGICSAMGTWDFTHDPTAEFKLILLCICGILYIATLAFYSTYNRHNPGTNGWHMEWAGKRVSSATNLGENIIA